MLDLTKTFEPTNTEVNFFVDSQGEKWTQAKSIFEVLELSVTNLSTTLDRHVFPDFCQRFAIGVGCPAWYLKTEGLIQLGVLSKSKHAEPFQRWVFATIKTIMATGGYQITDPDKEGFKLLGFDSKIETLTDKTLTYLNANLSDPSAINAYNDTLKILQRMSEHSKLETEKNNKSNEVQHSFERETMDAQQYILRYMQRQACPITAHAITKLRYFSSQNMGTFKIRSLLTSMVGETINFHLDGTYTLI